MKRIIAVFLTLVLAFSSLVCFANAETTEDRFKKWNKAFGGYISVCNVGDWVYATYTDVKTVNGKLVSFSGQSNELVGYIGDKTDITIPSNVLISCFHTLSDVKTIRVPKDTVFYYENCYISYENCFYFKSIESLEKIIVDKENKSAESKNGVLYSKGKKELYCYPASKKGKSFTLPGTIKRFDFNKFNNTKYLQNLTIPNTVKEITSGTNCWDNPTIKNVYFKNDSIKISGIEIPYYDDDGYYRISLPNAKIHCFKGSTIDKFLHKKLNNKLMQEVMVGKMDTYGLTELSCKKICYLSKPKAPKAVAVKSAKYTKKNGIKITVNKYKATGVKVYRLSGKKYKYIGYTHSRTFIDKTAKAGKTYKYKVRAYNKKNGIAKNSKYSSVLKVKASKKR